MEGQVLTVCTGNVCRSPVLERTLQHALDQRWGSGTVPVRSAGTGALAGSPMQDLAAAQLGGLGGVADGFAARQITRDLVGSADLVLTATRQHRALVAQQHPRALRYAFTFLDFADLAENLQDEELPQTEDAGDWVRQVTSTLAARRGLRPPLQVGQVDIVDPYGRDERVYAQMSRQIGQGLPHVIRALTGRAPLPV